MVKKLHDMLYLANTCASKLQFELFPIAPFRLDLTTWVLKRRPEDALHQWDGEYFRRVFVVRDAAMLVEVKQVAAGAKPRLKVTVPHPPRLENLEVELIGILTQVLGLNTDLSCFYEMALQEPRLADLARRFRGVNALFAQLPANN
jgi:DNA-3-methyladenine glycosylase II